MKDRIKKLIILFLLFIVLSELHAQEANMSAGSNASGFGGSASYSIGQVVYTTQTGSNGTVTQGVQQAYEISVINGIEDVKDINFVCTAYPNPATDFLTLNIENYDNKDLSYQLFDISGELLESKKLTSNETTITMTNRVSAIYFLKVIDNQQEKIKTFKIIKQ